MKTLIDFQNFPSIKFISKRDKERKRERGMHKRKLTEQKLHIQP